MLKNIIIETGGAVYNFFFTTGRWRHLTEERNVKMASFEDLPPELLTYLFNFLDGTDLASVAQVNRKFYDASNVDSVWQKLCIRGL